VRAARAALERSGVDQAMLADIELGGLGPSTVTRVVMRTPSSWARTALARRERASGPRSIQLTSVLNNLGGTLRMWGRPDEAIAAYQRALAIYEEHAPDHRENGHRAREPGCRL
jgi:hypothetical protein